MAQIHILLSKMNAFLNGKDQSSSEYFFRLADEYASASASVYQVLEECRKLIESGNASQALSVNWRVTPSYTERARTLLFPGRSRWLELCHLYKAAIPPEPDMALIEKLESGTFCNSVKQNKDLIMQWHVVGSSGTPHEKVVLLRELLRRDNTTDVWRTNLKIAEKAWIREKLNEAESAKEIKDWPFLYSIIQELHSPELLNPVPQSAFEPFQQNIQDYCIRQMKEKQEQVLKSVEEAYGMEDAARLGSELSHWNRLSEDPLFVQPSSRDSELLKKAEEHYMRKKEEERKLQESRNLQQLLNQRMVIREEENFKDIEFIRNGMQKLKDLPGGVNKSTEEWFQALECAYRLHQKRLFFRKSFAMAITAILFASAVIAMAYGTNRYFAIQSVAKEMSVFLDRQTPEKAIDYFNNLKNRKHYATYDTGVLALYENAEKLKKKQDSDSKYVGGLFGEIRKDLDQEKLVRCQEQLSFVKTKKYFMNEDQKKEFGDLEQRLRDLEKKKKQEKEQRFCQKVNDFLRRGGDALRKLDDPRKCTVDQVDSLKASFENGRKEIFFSVSGITPDMVKSNKEKVLELMKNLRTKADDAKRFLQVRNRLYHPVNCEDFFKDLDEIEKLGRHSVFLKQEFGEAIRDKEVHRQYVDFKMEYTPIQDHPFLKDYWFIHTPAPDAMNKVKQQLTDLEKKSKEWDKHEIILQSKGVKYYFYLNTPIDKGSLMIYRSQRGAGGAYKDMLMNVCCPGNRTLTLKFKFHSMKNVYTLVLQKPPRGLPDTFTDISPSQIRGWDKPQEIPQAAHFTAFSESLKRLSAIKEPVILRKELIREIRKYVFDDGINPNSLPVIIDGLLKIYGMISEIDRVFSEQLAEKIFFRPDPFTWGTDERVKNTVKFFRSEEFDRILKKEKELRALYSDTVSVMAPSPAGIILRGGNEILFQKFEDPPQSNVYFTCLRIGEKDFRFVLLPEILWKNGKCPLTALPARLENISNGTIVYASSGDVEELMQRISNVDYPPRSIPQKTEGMPQ